MTKFESNEWKPKKIEQFNGVVRSITLDDVQVLRPILETWIKDRETGKTLPDEVEENLQLMTDSVQGKGARIYLVAESIDGKVIGVIGFKTPDQRLLEFTTTSNPAEAVNAYVAKDKRGGKGVGRALFAELENQVKNANYTEVVLCSGPRHKETGWSFFDKLEDYKRSGVAKNYFGEGEDALVWSKVL